MNQLSWQSISSLILRQLDRFAYLCDLLHFILTLQLGQESFENGQKLSSIAEHLTQDNSFHEATLLKVALKYARVLLILK